ncbi:MAG: hypothetical protein JXA21_10150 [Anaerolineae bacterium]|nr:hypothetical protein [Anaerolineae bacterium]
MANKQKRWKSDKFEVQQSENSPYYWLMKATNREDRMSLTLAELKELRELVDRVLRVRGTEEQKDGG